MSDQNYVPPVPPVPPATPPTDKKKYIWPAVAGVAVLALIIALVVGFTGRDSGNEPEAAPSPVATATETATAEPEVAPSETPRVVPEAPVPPSIAAPSTGQTREGAALTESGFLAVLRDMYPELNNVPDEEIMQTSNRVCNMLDDGATPEEVLFVAVASAKSEAEAEANGAIVGASVSNYCPEYAPAFEKFLAEAEAAAQA